MTDIVEVRRAKVVKGDAKSLKTLLAGLSEEQAVQVTRTTVAQRKDRLRQALEKLDIDRLLELQETMKSFVDEVTGNEVVMDEPRQLTKAESVTLMRRLLAQRDVAEFLEVTKDLTWELVRTSIMEAAAADGHPDPEHANGRLEVPEEGYAFCLEANGQKDPDLDEAKLEALLGDRWADVCDVEHVEEQVIPAHDVYEFSPEKLMAAAATDPVIMEAVREALIVGGWKPGRRMIRTI